LFLKTVNEIPGARSLAGRLFHRRGPWTANLRWPCFVLVLVTTRCLIYAQGSRWWPVHVDVDSQYDCRYCGAAPRWHLYARTAVLKVIRHQIVSQWRLHKTGVICSHFLAPVMWWAAAFWTAFSFCGRWLLIPASKLLLESNRLLTKACISDLVASSVSACFIDLRWRM